MTRTGNEKTKENLTWQKLTQVAKEHNMTVSTLKKNCAEKTLYKVLPMAECIKNGKTWLIRIKPEKISYKEEDDHYTSPLHPPESSEQIASKLIRNYTDELEERYVKHGPDFDYGEFLEAEISELSLKLSILWLREAAHFKESERANSPFAPFIRWRTLCGQDEELDAKKLSIDKRSDLDLTEFVVVIKRAVQYSVLHKEALSLKIGLREPRTGRAFAVPEVEMEAGLLVAKRAKVPLIEPMLYDALKSKGKHAGEIRAWAKYTRSNQQSSPGADITKCRLCQVGRRNAKGLCGRCHFCRKQLTGRTDQEFCDRTKCRKCARLLRKAADTESYEEQLRLVVEILKELG